MTRTRQFVRGVGAGYLNQAVVMLVGLWMTRFLLARIGSYNYGLWFQLVQVLAYLALIDLGVAGLLPRDVAHASGSGNAAERYGAILGPVTRLVWWQTVFAALGSLAVAAYLLPPPSAAPLRLPLGIVLSTFVLTFPLRIYSSVLMGLQELAFMGAAQLAAWLLGTSVTIALAFMGYGLTSLAAGYAAGQILPAVLARARVRRVLGPAFRITAPPLTWALLKEQIGRSIWVSVSQVAQALISGSDILIVGRVMGSGAVVPYVCTEKLAGVFEHQPQLLMQSAQPGLAQLRSGASRERMVQAATALMTAMLVVSGALLCVVLAVNRGFVLWWVKAPAWAGFTLTALVVLRVIVGHWLLTFAVMLFCMGYERRLAVTSLVNGAVSLALSIGLARVMGWPGVPLGAVIAHLVVSLPVYALTLRKELGAVGSGLAAALWPWAWRFGLLAATALFAGAAWLPTSVPALAAVTLATLTAYAAIMLPILMRPPVDQYLDDKIHRALLYLPRWLHGGAKAR